MRVLLDTHALLWTLENNPRLSARALQMISDPAVEKLVSAVSAYEVCLKHSLGKLPEFRELAIAFEQEIRAADCTPLPITVAHAEVSGRLPMTHRDPFDRFLVAQAVVEGVPLVSNEAVFDQFGVDRIW